jgi:hypothetical protein
MKNIKQLSVLLADNISNFIGSWTFIIIQTVVVIIWVIINLSAFFNIEHFDPYPFILLNLFFSTEAAYATPLILMASKTQAIKDSAKVDRDLLLDQETNRIIKRLEEDLLIDKVSLKDHKKMQKDIKKILHILK